MLKVRNCPERRTSTSKSSGVVRFGSTFGSVGVEGGGVVGVGLGPGLPGGGLAPGGDGGLGLGPGLIEGGLGVGLGLMLGLPGPGLAGVGLDFGLVRGLCDGGLTGTDGLISSTARGLGLCEGLDVGLTGLTLAPPVRGLDDGLPLLAGLLSATAGRSGRDTGIVAGEEERAARPGLKSAMRTELGVVGSPA